MGLGIVAALGLTDQSLARLPDNDKLWIIARATWKKTARPKQLPPPGDWRVWLMQAGRGGGKTRPAAEWLWWEAWCDPGSISHVVARRAEDHRTTTFGGPSGLLACIPPCIIKNIWRSPWAIELINGSKILGFTASEPNTLRGPQCHRTWCDELAGWENVEDAWAQVQLSTRLKSKRSAVSRIVVSTTPRPISVVATLNKRYLGGDTSVVITAWATWENSANLDELTLVELKHQYEGTRLGRQELEGELLDPEELGIIQRSWLRMWPTDKLLPSFEWVILSLDTAFTEDTIDEDTGEPDYTACTVWGVFHHDKKRQVMLLDAWHERLGFVDLLKRVRDEKETVYGEFEEPIVRAKIGPTYYENKGRSVDLIVVEDKGSGISLRQVMEREGIAALAYNPGRAKKIERLHMVSHVFEKGWVWIMEGQARDPNGGNLIATGKLPTWTDTMVEQICTFSGEGSIKHDDYVDSVSQAIRVILDKRLLSVNDPAPIVHDGDDRRKPLINPYSA